MKSLRRHFEPGKTYFLTHVAHERQPILLRNVALLWSVLEEHYAKEHFNLVAWAILPDHWHVIIDPQHNELSSLMRDIKRSFAQTLLRTTGRQSGRIWQNRFWDHMIRDDEDMNRHIDYIHFNPVKHGLVKSPFEYVHSSFRRFVKDGLYEADWRSDVECGCRSEFGE